MQTSASFLLMVAVMVSSASVSRTDNMASHSEKVVPVSVPANAQEDEMGMAKGFHRDDDSDEATVEDSNLFAEEDFFQPAADDEVGEHGGESLFSITSGPVDDVEDAEEVDEDDEFWSQKLTDIEEFPDDMSPDEMDELMEEAADELFLDTDDQEDESSIADHQMAENFAVRNLPPGNALHFPIPGNAMPFPMPGNAMHFPMPGNAMPFPMPGGLPPLFLKSFLQGEDTPVHSSVLATKDLGNNVMAALIAKFFLAKIELLFMDQLAERLKGRSAKNDTLEAADSIKNLLDLDMATDTSLTGDSIMAVSGLDKDDPEEIRMKMEEVKDRMRRAALKANAIRSQRKKRSYDWHSVGSPSKHLSKHNVGYRIKNHLRKRLEEDGKPLHDGLIYTGHIGNPDHYDVHDRPFGHDADFNFPYDMHAFKYKPKGPRLGKDWMRHKWPIYSHNLYKLLDPIIVSTFSAAGPGKRVKLKGGVYRFISVNKSGDLLFMNVKTRAKYFSKGFFHNYSLSKRFQALAPWKDPNGRYFPVEAPHLGGNAYIIKGTPILGNDPTKGNHLVYHGLPHDIAPPEHSVLDYKEATKRPKGLKQKRGGKTPKKSLKGH